MCDSGSEYFFYTKGPTIRKVMGGGGNFRAAGIVFVIKFLVCIFFSPLHEYFLGLIGVQEFFLMKFSLARIFFMYFARPPHKFSNGPSLMKLLF